MLTAIGAVMVCISFVVVLEAEDTCADVLLAAVLICAGTALMLLG